MKKISKKLISILLATILMLSVFTVAPFSVSAATINSETISSISQSEFDSKISSLRTQYPNYSTWYGSFSNASQCCGFAYLIGYNIFGSVPRNWQKTYNIYDVKVGDVIQYGNGDTGYGHTVFVTNVSGNTITFVDCNGNGNYSGGSKVRSCGIKWDNTIAKGANLFGYAFSYILSSPGINSTPPVSNPWISVERSTIAKGETINFSLGANNATSYTIGIDRNGSRVITQGVGNNASFVINDAGDYSAYVTCANSVNSIDSGRVYFTVIETVNLGDKFYALIKNKKTEKLLSEGNKLSDKANDVTGLDPVDSESQIWKFNRNSDGSYSIMNYSSNMYLDVEAGNNINNLLAQPNGTNVQTYYKYNGTDNQKFYICRVSDSYYIKPVGMDKTVDMGVSSNLVAIWDYVENFDPQKFDIVKIDINGKLPVNLGNEFNAYIKNKSSENVLSISNMISDHTCDVNGQKQNNSNSQNWKFIRENDGSYYIQNMQNGWYLDVEAGHNINNMIAQPNGTNIQTYYKYNKTSNQKFYIYHIFDSYYIKPVGTQRVLDMGISNSLVAIWDYADDFAPQKFDIVKIENNTSILGDVNSDGKVSIADVTAIQKYGVEKTTLNDTQFKLADVNKDGRVSIADATTIQKYLIGKAEI